MEIDSSEEAKSLLDKTKKLIKKIKENSPLTNEEKEDLILILSKATYEFYELSIEN